MSLNSKPEHARVDKKIKWTFNACAFVAAFAFVAGSFVKDGQQKFEDHVRTSGGPDALCHKLVQDHPEVGPERQQKALGNCLGYIEERAETAEFSVDSFNRISFYGLLAAGFSAWRWRRHRINFPDLGR